jgi:hypothetical protein
MSLHTALLGITQRRSTAVLLPVGVWVHHAESPESLESPESVSR